MFTTDGIAPTTAPQIPVTSEAVERETALLRALHHHQPLHTGAAEEPPLLEKLGLRLLVGHSPAFRAIVQQLPKLARCEANILLLGETGTGKELCARSLHYLSPRAAKPFIPVNCGAIPVELIENELFGHERGAYTDAGSSGRGVIAEAEGGTLFLDEIDCLPLPAQVKLLRFLQEKEYRPLGSPKTRKASVRIITATNTCLEQAIHQRSFRRDLYYRINILALVLPPLRDRPEDIGLLAHHFLAKFAAEFAKPVTEFSPDALQLLQAYAWPGNVRELEHAIERAVALTEDTTIGEAALCLSTCRPLIQAESFHHAKARAVADFEQRYLKDLLLTHAGNITKAAQAAGKHRRAFWQLLRKHGLSRLDLRTSQATDLDKR